MKETSDFTYVVGLERASWEDAWSLCQSYATGFYLANMNGAVEAGLLQSWLSSLSITEPYGMYGGRDQHSVISMKGVIVYCLHLWKYEICNHEGFHTVKLL